MTTRVYSRKRERLEMMPKDFKSGKILAGTLRQISTHGGAVLQKKDKYVFPEALPPKIERVWDDIHPGPPYRSGGNFLKVLVELPQFNVLGSATHRTNSDYWDSNSFWEYTGGFGQPDFSADVLLSSAYMNCGSTDPNEITTLMPNSDVYCSEVYNRLRPQLEHAGLGVAIAEIRDVPHMLKQTGEGFKDIYKALGGDMKSTVMRPKKVADQFLNGQFGWVPFLKDVQQVVDVYDNTKKYMAQVTRDNGSWTRRVRTIKTEETENVILRGYGLAVSPQEGIDLMCDVGSFHGSQSQFYNQLTEKISTHIWCAGSMKYYRPEFDPNTPDYASLMSAVKRRSVLYGARINPSIVYKATPWSWLVDWFSSTGDAVQRATDWAYDGVVSRYMYLMHHHIRELKMEQTINWFGGAQVLSWSRYSDIKRRNEAGNPYDFCLKDWSNLTSRQLAILAALGISKH